MDYYYSFYMCFSTNFLSLSMSIALSQPLSYIIKDWHVVFVKRTTLTLNNISHQIYNCNRLCTQHCQCITESTVLERLRDINRIFNQCLRRRAKVLTFGIWILESSPYAVSHNFRPRLMWSLAHVVQLTQRFFARRQRGVFNWFVMRMELHPDSSV